MVKWKFGKPGSAYARKICCNAHLSTIVIIVVSALPVIPIWRRSILLISVILFSLMCFFLSQIRYITTRFSLWFHRAVRERDFIKLWIRERRLCQFLLLLAQNAFRRTSRSFTKSMIIGCLKFQIPIIIMYTYIRSQCLACPWLIYIIYVTPHTCMYMCTRVRAYVHKYAHAHGLVHACMNGHEGRTFVPSRGSAENSYHYIRIYQRASLITALCTECTVPVGNFRRMYCTYIEVLRTRLNMNDVSFYSLGLQKQRQQQQQQQQQTWFHFFFSPHLVIMWYFRIGIRSFIYLLIWMARHYHSLNSIPPQPHYVSTLFSIKDTYRVYPIVTRSLFQLNMCMRYPMHPHQWYPVVVLLNFLSLTRLVLKLTYSIYIQSQLIPNSLSYLTESYNSDDEIIYDSIYPPTI